MNRTRDDRTMKQTEPPSVIVIGKNSRGCWVAQEQNGLFGGLFINRAEAVRYALFENGRRPEAIVPASHTLELDMSGPVRSEYAAPAHSGDHGSLQLRRVA
jgi:hypothetical protein